MPKEEDKNIDEDEEEDDDDEEDEEEEDEKGDDNKKRPSKATGGCPSKTDGKKDGEDGGDDGEGAKLDDMQDFSDKLIDGFLNIQEENDKGKFVSTKQYYAKFLFKGRFLVFFTSEELKNIPVFYIKVKYILSIEDFYNNNPAIVFIEFYDGKREKRIVLVVPALKEKEKWVDTISEQKDLHEDDEENEDEDFGRTQLETRYLLAEEYESNVIRHEVV